MIVPEGADGNKPHAIKVVKIRPVQDGGNVRAFATVEVDEWTLYACRVVQQPGQRAFAQLPMKEGSGGKSYPILGCNDTHLAERVKACILTAWAGYQEQENDVEQLGLGLGEVER